MSENEPRDEAGKQIEQDKKKLAALEENLKDKEKKLEDESSPPKTMSTPKDFNKAPHLPGLG